MKKSKILAAAVTASVMALGIGALAGCGHTHEYSDKWEKDETAHWHVATCDDLKEGDKEYKKDYAEHVWGDDDECDVCKYTRTPTPPPAAEGHTIRLNVGDGTVANGTVLEYKTVDGKLPLGADEYLPEPTAPTNWKFVNWYDAEEGGNAIDEHTAEFTKDTELYARYVRNDGFWNEDGSELIASLVQNNAAGYTEYWFGTNKKVTITAGTVLTVYIDGEQPADFWLTGGCIDAGTGKRTSKITVTEDAEFEVYVKIYGPTNWTCEFTGKALNVKTTSTIPTGCEKIEITVKSTQGATLGTISLYIVDDNGVAITSTNGKDYQVHAYNGADSHFGAWGDNPKLNEEEKLVITYDNISAETNFMFHWSTESDKNRKQTTAINNMEIGNTYVIDLSKADEAILYVAPEAE